MDKPAWFNKKDLFTFGIFAVSSTTLSALAWVVEIEAAGKELDIRLGLHALSVFAVALYALVMFLRKRKLSKYSWLPKHGVLLDPGGFDVPHADINNLLDRVLDGWEKEANWPARQLMADNYLYISFRALPLIDPDGKNVLGYPINKSFEVVVGISEEGDVVDTSLEHELNHIFYGHFIKKWDHEEHHQFFMDYGFK